METKLENIGFYTLSEQRARGPRKNLQRCELIVTPRCNFRCPYCRGLDMLADITMADAGQTLRYWVEWGLQAVRFSGGEPTLHPALPDICLMAKCLGIKRIAVSTNGSADLAIYESLLQSGVDDFSISLDACCSADGEKMCGVPGAWSQVVSTIRFLAERAYVTVGLVVTPDNLAEVAATIRFAHNLGVSDIRVIPAAQYTALLNLKLDGDILKTHPILSYRAARFSRGAPVRGIAAGGCRRCWLVEDDMAVMDGWHYPCIIYMRERGAPIGKVGPDMLGERARWSATHDCAADPICEKNCLDVCVQYNERAQFYAEHPGT